MTVQTRLTVYHDGHCPICRREINWLSSRNTAGLVAFQDIHADDFDAHVLGISHEALMAEIHGLTAEGELIKGIDVFQHAYTAVGLGWIVAPLRWSWTRPVFIRLYSIFARYRVPFTSRFLKSECGQGQCRNIHL